MGRCNAGGTSIGENMIKALRLTLVLLWWWILQMVMEQNVQIMRAFGMDGLPGDAYFLNDQDPLAAIHNHHRNLEGGRARRRRVAVDGLHGQ